MERGRKMEMEKQRKENHNNTLLEIWSNERGMGEDENKVSSKKILREGEKDGRKGRSE